VPANVCAACGGNPVLTAVVEKKAEAERRELARRGGKTAVESLVAPLVWWRLIRFALAGVFCIALGFCLIFSPIMRDNPNRLTLNDAAPGIGAIVVGVILFGLLVFVWRRSR
jgi:anti-sigma-K factor RskA